jgi:CNT family concentrative nucleoside transporter
MLWERLISLAGIFFILGIAWLMSNNKKQMNYRLIIWGLLLQLIFAFIILKTSPGKAVFDVARTVIVRILGFTDTGASFLFGNLYRATPGIAQNLDPGDMKGHVLLIDSETISVVKFCPTLVGKTDTLRLMMENSGTADLIVNKIRLQDSTRFDFLAPGLPFRIPVRSSQVLSLGFTPEKAGAFSNQISLTAENLSEPIRVKFEAEGTDTALPIVQPVIANQGDFRQYKDLGIIFAFHILPTIIFFAALMSVLYHYGIMQRIVQFMAWIMARTMGTSGAESLSAAANIFVGQTEAPLVIKPYVKDMTVSELMAVMVGGFATIAGGVMAAYVRFGMDAGHLMAASVMSAPAALLIAKIIYPEREEPKTRGSVKLNIETQTSNVIDAAASGAADGLRLAVNVGAMLMAFISLIALLNYFLGHIDELINFITFGATSFNWDLSLKMIFGYLFSPFAFFMGVSSQDILTVGHLLGTKISINEMIAYVDLGTLKSTLTPRSFTIATYALCGFANFSSIAIQIGGIGSIAPSRRSDLARIGLRAMLGGALASWLTAAIAGLLL